MTCFTLSCFSWSLFQFSLNLVVTRGRSFNTIHEEIEDIILDPSENIQNYNESEETARDLTKTFIEKLNTFQEFNPNSNQKNICARKCLQFFNLDLLDSEIWSILITLIFQVSILLTKIID